MIDRRAIERITKDNKRFLSPEASVNIALLLAIMQTGLLLVMTLCLIWLAI